MKIIGKIIIITLSLVSACIAAEIPTNPVPAEEIKQEITALMEENHIPGVAVELYIDGKPQSYYFGYAKPAKQVPVTKNTIFELGSISKVMTSLLLAQAVDAAKMQLNAPVMQYLPNLSTDFDDVSLKDLATHTAGVPFNIADNIKTQSELDNFLSHFSYETMSEEKWIYSNLGIGLLGNAIEHATHQNINNLYRQQILSPLHMQLIGLTVPAKLAGNYAQGYTEEGTEAPRCCSTSLLPAAGQMKASANDMQRFLSAAIGLPGTPETILYPMRLTQSAFVELPNAVMQGLGWQVHPLDKKHVQGLLDASDVQDLMKSIDVVDVYKKPLYSGDVLIDKTGMTNGFRTYIAVIPNKKTGIVILANKAVKGPAIVKSARKILFMLNQINPQEPASMGS